ncbi:extracellular solute-binding protein [Paenibacillus sp. ATY16]|uniref:ABC transporter substrate-binding protein n=1 Tax=Paenibacillus sp. ATY16 TaxID=1759312 RepID=UPI00200F285A|nr:extracellular solute-binding protein [Paenibacillus sp. ATY16]MCK9860342.1 extracellular solute-binding protein [Paenibacillus sp. ATY16]
MLPIKKPLMLSLTLAMLALSVTACGSNNNGNSNPSNSPSANSSASPEPSASSTAEPKGEQEAVTLNYLTWNYATMGKSTDAWIKGLKDKYNITINMQNVPSDNYPAAFKTKYAANDMPDLVMTHGIDRNLFMSFEKVAIKPEDFVDLSELPEVADFMPSVIADRKENTAGKLYYVPVTSNALGVLYNKKTFTDNGVAIPKNIDEFVAVAEKFKAAGIPPIEAAFKSLTQVQIIPFIAFGQYVNTKDMEIRKKLADGSMKYSDIKEDMMKVLQLQQEWRDKGYYQDGILGTDPNVAAEQVALGKTAMFITGTWQFTNMKNANPEAEIGYFPLPLNAAGEKTVVPTSADNGLMISAHSKHVDAAKLAMQYYLSPEIQALVVDDLKGIPTSSKVQTNDPFLKDVQDAMAAGIVQPDWLGSNGYYFPSGTTFNIAQNLQSLVADGTTIDQFLKDLDDANAKALSK